MDRRVLRVLVFSFIVVFLSTACWAELVTDDFNDGVIGQMWVVDNPGNGISFTESGGSLNITGTATPAQWLGGQVWNLQYDGSSPIQAQMKLKVPETTLRSSIVLQMTGTDGAVRAEYNSEWGYIMWTMTHAGNTYSSWTVKKGNEATDYNLIKLAYDPVAHTASAYLCDADGSNQQLIGTLGVDLCAGAIVPKVSVKIMYWTQLGASVDFRIDDFEVNATLRAALEPPPLALGISLGQRESFQPGGEDLFFPTFSNDGTKLAYLKRDNPDPASGVWNIYVKDLTSESSAYRVTEDSDWVSVHNTLSWSPNDKRIFFVTETPEGYSRLRYVDATETTDRVSHPYLTEYSAGWMSGVDFSRAADPHAAFIYNGELYTVQVDDFGDVTPGATTRQITDTIDFEEGLSWPKWSPDGARVTCGHSLTPHSAAIWVIDIAGLAPGDMIDAETHPNLTIITDTANFAGTPNFSYDGRYIYYCEDVNNVFNSGLLGWNRRNSTETMLGDSDFDLFVAKADGSAPPERLNIAPLSQGILSASPDGTLLAYNTDDDTDGDGVRDGDIYIQSLVSSQPISSAGGEVSDGSGTTVIVPEGALEAPPEEPVTITIETPLPGSEPPLDTLPVGTSLALAREFGPDGLEFATPVKIEIHYTDEEVAGLDESNLQIYYYNDAEMTWEALPSDEGCTDPMANVICAWVDHFSVFAALDVPTLMASVAVQPNSLNVKSKGNYLTAYIELPEGFDPANIDISSIVLNGSVAALASPTAVGDYNSNGVADLMVKFDRASVQSILPLGWAPVTVAGLLGNGVPFEDNLSIYVFDKGMSHQNELRTDSIVE
ncbi:MAG: hypothetical protein Kow0099_23150 [Candidatus Abyssubacteria bacterium]